MNRLYQIKRHFLIRLLSVLGFGSVIAYSICSCESKPVSQDVKQSETQVAPEANKEIVFQIEVTPSDAEVYILENNTETLLSKQSPCTYRFDTAKNSVGLKITAPDHKPGYRVITKDTYPQIIIELEPIVKQQPIIGHRPLKDIEHRPVKDIEHRPVKDIEHRPVKDIKIRKPEMRNTTYRARISIGSLESND